VIGKIRERFTEDFRIGGSRGGDRLAGVGLVLAESVKLVGLGDGGGVSFSLLGEDMKDDRLVLCLEKLEGADQ